MDAVAQEIRRVDGSNSLGAGALAEALLPFLERTLAEPVDPDLRELVRTLRAWGHEAETKSSTELVGGLLIRAANAVQSLASRSAPGGPTGAALPPDLLGELVDALAARCGTNAEERPLIDRARKYLAASPVPSKPADASSEE